MNKNNFSKYFGIIIAAVVVGVIAFVLARAPKVPVVQNPAPITHEGWETKSENGLSLMYPSDLGTKYITPTDWPPVLNISDQAFSCTEAGSETERAGETKLETINGNVYCVTRVTEGAAGSSYTQYAYARAFGYQTEILTFSLRFVQCGNYDESNKIECEAEREAFNITPTINEIFRTLKQM
jgi:hypothetical protein